MAAMISAMREKTMLPLGWALACVLMVAAPLSAQRVERQTLTVGGYVIDAELDPPRTTWRPMFK